MLFRSIYFCLRWVFVAARRLSLVVASRGYSLLQCTGFSLQWPLLLQSMGSKHAGFSSCGTWVSVVVAHGLQSAGSVVVVHGSNCSKACGILPDQGSNPCPLHWQADSYPLCHQGRPLLSLFLFISQKYSMFLNTFKKNHSDNHSRHFTF